VISRAPPFWERRAGFAAELLSPLGAAWDAVGRLRRVLARPYGAPVPVVCVGNLVLGGAGKTPVVLGLAAWLAERGAGPHVVARGYGGRCAGPMRVDPARHSAAAVGDEALLIAGRFPCWVARDRAAGIRAAVAAGAAAIVVDDGFQNPGFAKTLSLLVVDAAYRFGNGRVVPAGPLREDRERGLARADAVVLIRGSGEPPGPEAGDGFGDRPVVPAVLAPVGGERFTGIRLFAFAGIGLPEKFFATLRALGAELVATHNFPDHHRYRAREITALRRAANRAGSRLVTTAKDIVRLPAAERDGIDVLDVEILWSEPGRLAGLMTPILATIRGDGDGTIVAASQRASESARC
jgi:tetraacyldisaccharide 4'-kinase